MVTNQHSRSIVSAGAALGIGLGGFIDGIVFHQILQVHNMMSAVIPKDTVVNIEINMFWDGLFHAFCLAFTIAGVVMLFNVAKRRDVSWSGKILAGSMLLGWGTFNLVEGIIDHHLLGIHHVIERLGSSVWDYAFLGSGALFITVGLAMVRSEPSDEYATGVGARG